MLVSEYKIHMAEVKDYGMEPSVDELVDVLVELESAFEKGSEAYNIIRKAKDYRAYREKDTEGLLKLLANYYVHDSIRELYEAFEKAEEEYNKVLQLQRNRKNFESTFDSREKYVHALTHEMSRDRGYLSGRRIRWII